MDLKETGKKLKPFAPVLSVAVVASCVAGSLGGYQPPVYAAQEQTDFVKEETTKSEEQAQVAKGSFDLTDGVYKGTGTGYAGDITVAVQIKDKQIVAIDILSSSDDAAFFKRAQAVIDKIIEGQTLDVDTVSGATYSSRGIISAVKNALTGEKDSGTTGQSQSSSGAAAGSSTSVAAVEDPSAYKDGTYYGTGTGFGGEMTVQVTVSGGRITDIQILSSKDDSPYLQNASALLQNIIAAQSTNVDAVSGATFSSAGLIEAVRNALANAATGSAETTPAAVTEKKPEQTTAPAKPGKKGAFPYPDGVYTGSGEGYGGITKIELTLKDGTIEKIHVVSNEDDESFFKRAETLISLVIQRQSTDVDVVSGATFSSEGILEAINEALDAAKNAAQPAETTTTTVTTIAPPENTTAAPVTGTTSTETTTEPIEKIYDDGTYVGTADCYPDEDEDFVEYVLSVKVKIENDQIVSISDASGAGDSYDKLNDRYISRAAKGTGKITGTIAQILEKQHTDGIDAVSGATCSSDAIVRAVDDALAQARKGA